MALFECIMKVCYNFFFKLYILYNKYIIKTINRNHNNWLLFINIEYICKMFHDFMKQNYTKYVYKM